MNPPGVGGDLSVCTPFSSRDQTSFDFIRCEQGSGWVGCHFALAVSTFVFFPNFLIAAFIIFLAELLEWSSYILIAKPLGFKFSDGDLETISGSWVADVLIQGGSGLLVGYLYHLTWNHSPPLVPLRYFWNVRRDGLRRGIRFGVDRSGKTEKTLPTQTMIGVTLVFYIIYFALGAVHFWVGKHWNWGAIVFIGARLAFLYIFLAISSQDKHWERAIWGTRFPWPRRVGFLLGLWLLESAVNAHNIGFLYINNQWYQSWTVQGTEILILIYLVSVVASYNKKFYF